MLQSNLLLLNTAIVYLRMFLTIPMGILVVRFVYGELGEIDYGVWTTLGATTALASVVTSALVVSAQRHLAFEVGRGNKSRLKSVFKSVLAVFWSLGLTIICFGMILSPWILANLNIPPEREEAALWVLQFSFLSLALSTCFTPFRAMLTAHQAFSPVATSQFLTAILSLVNAWSLRYATQDKLISYVVFQTLITLSVGLFVVAIAVYRYSSCRVIPSFSNKSEASEIGKFAFWSFLSNMSATLRNQGNIIIVNIIFGPAANSAMAIAVQAHSYIYKAAISLNSVIAPALTSQSGNNNRQAVYHLMNFGCKLPFFAASMVFTPFVLETQTLLDLWQERAVPPDTVIHLRWLSGMALLGVATWGHSLLLEARNSIALLSRTQIATVVITMILGWTACRFFEWPAWSLSALVCCSTGFVSLLVRPWITARLIGKSWHELLRDSVIPSIYVMTPCFALAFCVHLFLPISNMRLFSVTSIYCLSLVPVAWLLGFNKEEHQIITKMLTRLSSKILSR